MTQESPTLDLINDCFRFVNGFFDAINISAPHIYHSALLLSPKTSIVHKLYGLQINPMARVVHGELTSWGQSIAIKSYPTGISQAVWSPCSKHIATAQHSGEITVLDAVTLKNLHTLHIDHTFRWGELIFSPDGYLLTAQSWGFQSQSCQTVSWDLQTGGLVSKIEGNETFDLMSFSGCGTMLGGLFHLSGRQGIVIYDIICGTQISSHSLPRLDVITIWTHGQCLQFATIDLGCVIIWEVSFTSTNPPIQVASFPVPFTFNFSDGVAFLPTLSQLSFIHQGKIIVWDALHQKILLDSIITKDPSNVEDFNDAEDSSDVSFSTGSHFLICRIGVQKYHLWKVSPDGYLPHQNSLPSEIGTRVVVSPNGEAIISFDSFQLQLWHTNSHTYSPTISPQYSQHTEHLLVEFSPDGSLVAITEQLDDMVTILDVKSGNPKLVIDTGIPIYGMRVTESSIIAVSDEEAVTWELPTGNLVPNAQGNIDNSIQITTFNLPQINCRHASISPGLNYIAFLGSEYLYICSMNTGEQLAIIKSDQGLPGFTLDGIRVWCAGSDYGSPRAYVDQWEIFRDDESGIFELKEIGRNMTPLSDFPWHSSCGYQVTDDGWVLSSNGKLLLWLPHQWQSRELERKWSGNFLVLLQMELPEAIILEILV